MKERFKKLIDFLNKLTDRKEQQIVSEYLKALEEIYSLLEKNYRQYEEDGKLTYDVMIKHNRLMKFEDELISTLLGLNKTIGNLIVDHLYDVYTEGYYQSGWVLETETQVKLSYSSVKLDVLQSAIQHNFTGLTLNERLKNQRNEVIIKLREVITRGLHEGQTIKNMSESIQNQLEMSATKSVRIARTESHRLIQQSSFDAAQQANKKGVIMMKEWMSMKDERVRRAGKGKGKKKSKADHKKLDGKKLPLDGLFDDGLSKGPAPGQLPAAGSSVNCRCILLYSVERIEKPQHPELKEMPLDRWKKERLVK